MKSKFIALAALALAIGAIALPPAHAEETPIGRVTVTGTGSVTLDRDKATTSFTVWASRTTAKAAMAAANTAFTDVRNGLIGAGADTKQFTTSGLSLYPEYDYTNGKAVLTGYRAAIGLTVGSTVKLAPTLVDVAVDAGGDNITIGGISFEASDSAEAADTSRTRAVANAKAKAALYAKSLGMTLGKAVKLVETSTPAVAGPEYAMDKLASAAIAIDPGTSKVTTTVEVTFILR